MQFSVLYCMFKIFFIEHLLLKDYMLYCQNDAELR